MNVDIANYPKPYIALCNGVVMGGGILGTDVCLHLCEPDADSVHGDHTPK